MVITVLVGAVLGFLSGLGVGGGSLLILWLTLVKGMPPESARSINLLFFLPAATVSLLQRRRNHKADIRRILPAILGGCVSALLLSCLNLNTSLLKKLFGILLVAAGLREILYKPKK